MKEICIFIVGVAVLAGFALLLMFLLQRLSLGDTEWNRAIYLFGGVEAIAFAAAGYFFGKEINRQRADNAEANATKQADLAASKTQDAAQAEERGQALRAAIDAKKQWLGVSRVPQEGRGSEPGVDELALLAEKLFPSRG